MLLGKQNFVFIFIFSLVINEYFVSFCLQLTFSILEKGFLSLNMHMTNDCLVMCVELSCESVVCWNIYLYVYYVN